MFSMGPRDNYPQLTESGERQYYEQRFICPSCKYTFGEKPKSVCTRCGADAAAMTEAVMAWITIKGGSWWNRYTQYGWEYIRPAVQEACNGTG